MARTAVIEIFRLGGVVGVRSFSAYLLELKEHLGQLPLDRVQQICDVLYRAYLQDKTIFLFGNGGSAALASHIACDLGKGTFAPGHVPLPGVRRLKVLSLADNVPMLSAWANDTDYENVFAEQLANFIQQGDIAFGISCSGNSANVLRALGLARERGAITVGLTGNQGGQMKELLDFGIVVASTNVQQIEDVHLVLSHLIFTNLRERIAG